MLRHLAGESGSLRKFGRFLIVGSLCTAVQYGVLIALVQLSIASPAVASCVGFGLSASLNYFLNYVFTFASDSPHVVAASRFAATALVGLGQTYLLMWFLVEWLTINYLAGQLITTGLVLASNFILLSRWAYVSHRNKIPV